MWVRQERRIWLPMPALSARDDGGRHAAHSARLLDRIGHCLGRPLAGEPDLPSLEQRWLRFTESCAAYAGSRATDRICMADHDPLFTVTAPRTKDGSGIALAAQAVTAPGAESANGATWLLLTAVIEGTPSAALRPRHLGLLGAVLAGIGAGVMWEATPMHAGLGGALIVLAAGLWFFAAGRRRGAPPGGSAAEHAFARLEVALIDDLDAVPDGVASEPAVPSLPFFARGGADVTG